MINRFPRKKPIRSGPSGLLYPVPHDYFFPRRQQNYIEMSSEDSARMFGVPLGRYWLREYYCLDPECSCNVVTVTIVNMAPETHARAEACISYGMESREYYAEVLGARRARGLERGMLGLKSEMGQGPNAKQFLKYFQLVAEGAGMREKFRRQYRDLLAKVSGLEGERLLARYERARQRWRAKNNYKM